MRPFLRPVHAGYSLKLALFLAAVVILIISCHIGPPRWWKSRPRPSNGVFLEDGYL
jgi:hypothetical protein